MNQRYCGTFANMLMSQFHMDLEVNFCIGYREATRFFVLEYLNHDLEVP